uniref:Uncharacterized protein n=1 Tax=Strongyloides papillosus TaxID=174720 RepID=A0A0N5C9R7_STREA
MLCNFFFTIFCLFYIFLTTQGQQLISGSSRKSLQIKKSQFELDFDLPSEAPQARKIKNSNIIKNEQFPLFKGSVPRKNSFDPEKALSDLSDYEDTVQFKKNGGTFLSNKDRNSFKISDFNRAGSELSRISGK